MTNILKPMYVPCWTIWARTGETHRYFKVSVRIDVNDATRLVSEERHSEVDMHHVIERSLSLGKEDVARKIGVARTKAERRRSRNTSQPEGVGGAVHEHLVDDSLCNRRPSLDGVRFPGAGRYRTRRHFPVAVHQFLRDWFHDDARGVLSDGVCLDVCALDQRWRRRNAR